MAVLHTLLLGLAISAPPPDASAPGLHAVDVARAAVLQRALEEGIEVSVESVGRVPAVPALGSTEAEWNADVPAARWLRPRLPVPITITPAGGGPARTVVVWLALSARVQGLVYSADLRRGTPASQLAVRMGEVDLARTHAERPALQPLDTSAGRLRRAVRSGEPVLRSDLETVPVVAAQQRVAIQAIAGPVRLATKGTALADGDVGALIAVLPDHAAQPVQGRVVSHEVVRIEH